MIDVRIHAPRRYELLENVKVQNVKGWDIEIYKGFIWDGASIPRELWDDIGCPLDFVLESLIHDGLYRTHLLSRKEADKIFHHLLIRNGVSEVKAKVMYLAVRLGGGASYDEASEIAEYRNLVSVISS